MPYTKSPTSYLGVKSRNPPNMFIKYRRPTINDIEPFNMGDFWVIPTQLPPLPTQEVWELVGMQKNQASWVQLNTASSISITGDSGGALTGNAFTFTGGSTGLTFSGATATETLTGTLVVANGGTGQFSFTANAPIIAGTSSTAALAQVTTGLNTAGYVLTANSSGAPTFQAASGGTAFSSIVVQSFTSTGAGTYTPTSGMSYCTVEAVGGGGGAGNCYQTSTNNSASGGGGAGGYTYGTFSAAAIGSSQSISVGVGGAGGAGTAAINNGTAGGNTTFGALLTANGGSPSNGTALNGSGTVGGAGGSASGGSVNITGQSGQTAIRLNSVAYGSVYSGSGGSGKYGQGGYMQIPGGGGGNDSLVGINASGYGAGGSGAAYSGVPNTTVTLAGGNGSQGIIIVTEFIS